jgi:hypothetical protein
MKVGTYKVNVLPKLNFEITDMYSIKFYGFNNDFYIARNVPVINAPNKPYSLIVDDMSATQPPLQALDCIANYIRGLPPHAFDKPELADNRKNALSNKFNTVKTQMRCCKYKEAIEKLQNDIRAKADGSVDGDPKNDWITDSEAQKEICKMIDDLVATPETIKSKCMKPSQPIFKSTNDISGSRVQRIQESKTQKLKKMQETATKHKSASQSKSKTCASCN